MVYKNLIVVEVGSFGLLGLIGWKVTVISSNFIALMLILTMAMNIHMSTRYLQLRNANPSKSNLEILTMTTNRMYWPILYTVLTTIIAFLSLIFSEIKPIIDFGWMMTFGLVVSFIITFTLLPTLLSFSPRENILVSENKNSKFTSFLGMLSIKKQSAIFTVTIVVIFLSIFGISKLEVENSFINYFSKKTEIYKGMKLIDEELGGTTPLEVIIKFPDKEKIDLILLSNSEIKTDINSKNSKVNILGKYSINQNTFLPFDLENIFSENKINLKLKADYDQNFDIELLNYKKQIGSIANISLILEKQNEKLKIQEFSFKEKKNIILAEEIMIQNDKFISMENFIAKTSKENGVFNNDFKVSFGKKINISGEKFDASNLPKIINKGSNRNDFSHINKDIEIDFKNVIAPLAENLKNFKLIGTIDRGKFSKISSKLPFKIS